jgi:hypothetical protein
MGLSEFMTPYSPPMTGGRSLVQIHLFSTL